MKSGKVSPVLYVILGVSFGLLGFFLLLANPFGWKLPTPTLTKTTPKSGKTFPPGTVAAPTPYLILPHGKQTYNAQGKWGESTVTSITYDPLDPARDTKQTVTATIQSKEAINTVSLTLNTDAQTTTHPMKLISGTATQGVWSTTYQFSDTYEKIYNVSFEITTELGNKTSQPMLIK